MTYDLLNKIKHCLLDCVHCELVYMSLRCEKERHILLIHCHNQSKVKIKRKESDSGCVYKSEKLKQHSEALQWCHCPFKGGGGGPAAAGWKPRAV